MGNFLASVPAELPEKICWSLSQDYQNQPGGHLRIFNKNNLINDITALNGFDYDLLRRISFNS